ncbi:bifunctional hydroxymethylpyrimidine kinase/phosphomethylpyrimidine kinase [uncultured Pelagimonas sp.]|uniref:bifunctional hydroxymethylpyrimidine kinase/phosphomethylpyrimidine kinase n=1 Tax=uncultured Pelagimonas sp. TaxID=1618102 RepID=UPI0026116198|nr:bifunctional hydroxymethylpyrimidine kinase/phosphomethylpyrimidine kinase [uncultured Pelagimonas sp.]
MIPNILSIAGSDPSGGAGVQADLKAIAANGGYGMAAITALTVQNTQGVSDVVLTDPGLVAAQVDAILTDIRVDAVKIGMLGSETICEAVAGCLAGRGVQVVVDPVLSSTSGKTLTGQQALEGFLHYIVPLSTVLTPNLPEAAVLLGCDEARDRGEMLDQAEQLHALGPAILLKGGHLPGPQCPDVLVDETGPHWFEAERMDMPGTHGTGCTLSSALATQIAVLGDLCAAVANAKTYTRNAILGSGGLEVGQGVGPTDHFFALRR